MRKLVTIAIATSALVFIGCSGETNGKGEESPLPTQGSADTWWSPTVHGELMFDMDNPAAFAEGALFHAWDFTLTGEALVELLTLSSENNMDTVMYLYRRDAGETHWGSYILRNDDHGESMLSRMKEELGAGEYRVMVKGYKDHIRGQFSVAASCEGDGCPVKGICDADTVENSIPRMEGYGAGCVAQMGEVLSALPESTRSIFVTQEDHCSLPDNARYAWEYYYNYWDGLLGWESLAWDPDEPISFDMRIADYGEKGALIDVDYGGDEMAMTFLFGADGELLFYFQHNQSPYWEFSCVADDETPTEGPTDSTCLVYYLDSGIVGHPDSSVSGQLPIDEVATEHTLVGAAAKQYGIQFELPSESVVDFSYVRWDSQWGETVEACFQSGDFEKICYRVGENHIYTQWNADDGTDASFVCADVR